MLCDNSQTAFSMAEISYLTSQYGSKTMYFFCPKGWKKVTFSDTLAGISTLTQWTPCKTEEVEENLFLKSG